MKVVVVARHYWPKSGAATVRLGALVEAWVVAGDEVVVVSNRLPGQSRRGAGPHGETIVRIAGDNETGVGVRRVLELLWFAMGAFRELRRLKADVVICDPPPTVGLAALLARSPVVVYYIADSWAEMLGEGGGSISRLLGRAVAHLENSVLRHAATVIAVRENLAVIARHAGSTDTVVAPYGTDLETFRHDGEIWDDPWGGHLPYFLYAGNYGVIQGGHVFLDAARELWREGESFGLVFMGYGSDESRVQKLAIEMPDVFVSLPLVPASITAAAYRGALAGLASMRPVDVASETRPAKALASIASGCPIIFAGTGTFATEVSENRLGRAAEWNPDAVADVMRELLATAASMDGDSMSAWRRDIADFGRQHLDMQPVARMLRKHVIDRGTALGALSPQ
ncbi:glycosyltransferase [Nocardioides sp. AX2bis]|uniref:glycosyltransferase n=1 Tax=Nocardioides sp. AX2bis TaxID=2653157 RepID=UPI0022A6E493|nr:glycosyltransferase [Nocardioides sp. AX2bis]